ncbi:glutamate-rich protein 6B [Microtus oregoni]|uniref:glutamate-rich protein 6B n=1 Tax=Microtus oregoni TaxID=111838 RepID=UPI001BB2B02B|nr:glutamate-rich protein 6B [Microtus oregoni]
MSDDTSSSEPSGSSPTVAPKHYTVAASSDGEDSEEQEDESSLEESLGSLEYVSEEYMDSEESLEDEEFVEEEEFLEESDYLEEEDYLDEKTFLQREAFLFKGAFVEEKTYLKEKHICREEFLGKLLEGGEYLQEGCLEKHLKGGEQFYLSIWLSPVPHNVQESSLLSATPSGSDHDLKFTTSSYYSFLGAGVSLRDQSSQTEWPYYESKMGTPLRSTTILDQDSSFELTHKKSDLEDTFPQGSFWDAIINGPFDKQDAENFDSLPSTYQSVFREILRELASQHELELEDEDVPLSKLLEGENRKKLGLLLKKNFEKHRESIMWIINNSEDQKMDEESTTTITYLVSALQQPQKPEAEEVRRSVSTIKKTLKLDAEWIQAKMKVHQGDGKIITYRSGNIFHILFPNGTGQIYYPSGNLALLIACKGVSKVTYIVLEDCVERKIRGLVTNSGHATFYNEDGEIWLSLSKFLGYYFPEGRHQKVWNWWDLNFHVHAPPVMCITLKLNKYVHIQIRSQDKVIFCFFVPKRRRICINMGTRFKSIKLKLLQAMKKKAVLETEPGPTSWKIQALLGKISRGLNFLSLSDLEHLIEVVQDALSNLSARKSRIWL